MKKGFLKRGFTLIELMLVVAIISLLAAIAIPKFANMVIKAKEASIRGQLGSVRSTVAIYYADNEGTYPQSPHIVYQTTKYSDGVGLPNIRIPTVPAHQMGNYDSPSPPAFPDMGNFGVNWGYVLPQNGAVWVLCTHTDSGGRVWSTW